MSKFRWSLLGGLLIFLGVLVFNEPCDTHTQELSLKSSSKTLSKKDNPYSPADNYYLHMQQSKQAGHAKLDAPEEYAKIQRSLRTPSDRTSPEYSDNYKLEAIEDAKLLRKSTKRSGNLDFIERGPGNVAGRTRAILVLPTDPQHNTWLAGSATGGIWKTIDGGRSWIDKTPELPNLGTNTLAMSAANPNVIYAGTGEHFTRDIDGVGMFKSEDEGETWTQIVRPGDHDAFRNVSRIIVHPEDEDIIIATTRNSVFEDSLRAAIYKSIDGGLTWSLKRLSTEERYDDIVANAQNFSTLYVAVRAQGVIKSYDQGESWSDASIGLEVSGRIEIATSPIDTSIVWGSAQGGRGGGESHLYMSVDGGSLWKRAVEDSGDPIDFLGGQGWYDNVIMPHPFERNTVYVGGVNLFEMEVSRGDGIKLVYEIVDDGALSFLDFVNGTMVGGGIFEGNLESSEVVSLELRFTNVEQKAHRFIVNKRGSGVPVEDYLYVGLVDIPFQVWDITNDRQLMVSFRDQAEDGLWTLKERVLNSMDTPNDSREYIFVHDETYAPVEHDSIARNGGQAYRQQKFFWPVLKPGRQFNPSAEVPQSFSVVANLILNQLANTTVISDAYNDFNGNNGFSGQEFANNQGQHPDQHGLQAIIVDSAQQRFQLLSTNDGGVYITTASTSPGTTDRSFRYAGFGYNTSQFYGADKRPGSDRYIGGMQDNSTWFTGAEDVGAADAFYEFAFGGDGFEALWNNRNPDLIIGSVQFNGFQRSTDDGLTWTSATTGIDDRGPFVSRLANNRAVPDRIFTVGSSGVWYSTNFGGSWSSSPIEDDLWSFNNSTDIDVSPANPDVVWAGGALDESRRLFVSTDGGMTFGPTTYYDQADLGTCSGIGLHPADDQIAYALFSFARRPKVLKTSDQGQTWEDISGFEQGAGVGTRGFPDVAVNCLLVFPSDTNRIWVGTEIGIVESLDGGALWSLLDANLPAVNISDMKIQDDQVVIATYGRGIWSVQVEGVAQTYVFPPIISEVAVRPNGGIALVADVSSEFDSLYIIVDEDVVGGLGTTITPGELALNLSGPGLGAGEHTLQLEGFRDGISYFSFPVSLGVFIPGAPTELYFNDFSVDSLLDDFTGAGFSVRLEAGFDDPAIHSDHNYDNRRTVSYQLKTPIIVSEDQIFEYRDVAIIETGEDFTSFGDQDFYDFVVAEGSLDGITWTPLFDGYDSSLDPSWETTYRNQADGNESLYVDHQVDLKDTYDIGAVIFIRYRLFADPGLNAWGWAIDDVNIRRETTTPVFTLEFESLSIYPNPVQDALHITLPHLRDNVSMILSDAVGRIVHRVSSYKGNNYRLDVADYREGIYFLEIYNEGRLMATEKVVVVR